MTSFTNQTMTSSRFLADGGSFQCVCCDAGLFDKDGFCPTCQAPTSLSKAIADRGAPGQFISVLGASNAGKTVYLGMLLDMLTKGIGGLRGLPNNSLSVAVQEQTINALEQCQFPEKTPNDVDQWKWMHCELDLGKRKGGYFDIISPDFAGEAISFEMEQPGSFPVVGHVVKRSVSFVLLIDSIRVRDSGREEDFFAMKIASYIHAANAKTSKFAKKKVKLPLAIVMTKCDSCPEAVHDPQGFAKANMPGFEKYLDRHFSSFKFFAASVVGSSATMVDRYGRVELIPFHVSPQGILEPIQWIIKQ